MISLAQHKDQKQEETSCLALPIGEKNTPSNTSSCLLVDGYWSSQYRAKLQQLFPLASSIFAKLTVCWVQLHILHADMKVTLIFLSYSQQKDSTPILQNVKLFLSTFLVTATSKKHLRTECKSKLKTSVKCRPEALYMLYFIYFMLL